MGGCEPDFVLSKLTERCGVGQLGLDFEISPIIISGTCSGFPPLCVALVNILLLLLPIFHHNNQGNTTL